MFKRILVPVDGSRASELGLAKAIRLAKDQRATLCLLHVVDQRGITQTLAGEGGVAVIDQLFDSLRASGKQIVAKAEASARKQRVRAKAVMVENISRTVADAIIAQARRWRADLILMGTHGRRGLSRLVMGSDAEAVVRAASAPVLLVRASKAR
jgi:nucleotide-binding universal stress UspA family protein